METMSSYRIPWKASLGKLFSRSQGLVMWFRFFKSKFSFYIKYYSYDLCIPDDLAKILLWDFNTEENGVLVYYTAKKSSKEVIPSL